MTVYTIAALHEQKSWAADLLPCYGNATLSDNDFAGSICAWRHLIKLILDMLLWQYNGLMICNKTEWINI